MRIRRLRNKLLLGAVAICILLALAYMTAVSLIIREQYLDQSNSLLQNALKVVEDGLSKRKSDLLAASRDLATQKDLGSTIWYLTQYASSEPDREVLFNTYQQLVQGTRKTGLIARASRVLLYNSAGKLVAFARLEGTSDEAGYVDRFSKPRFHVVTTKSGQESSWRKAVTDIPGISPSFQGKLPRRENMHYAVIDGSLSIEVQVPIIGQAFDSATGKPEIEQLGLVDMVQPIGQSFAEQFAELTNTDIDIFTRQRLSSGKLAAYMSPDWGGGQPRKAIFNQIRVAEVGYYQCLLPLYDGSEFVGAVSMLHSREAVRKNIWEMIRTLWLIAGASVLLIFPLVWYFATSISRPLTLLSRIFRGLASGKQLISEDEFAHLESERNRNDELGDLAKSFMAMNDAVRQKIAQINEINASLEQKISERTAELAASEQESRTLIENSPDIIARYDRDCRRIYVNAAFGEVVEGGTKALLGRKPSEYPGGAESGVYEERIGEVFSSGRSAHFEMEWLDKEGREICSHIRLSPEFDLYGNVATVLGISRDITDLKASQKAILLESQKFETLLHAAGDGIHILDLSGNVLQANESFCRMLGYTPDEVIGMNVAKWDAHFSPEELKERVPALMTKSVTFESRHRKCDGEIIDVEINTVGVEISGQKMLFCSSRDITARKQLDESRRMASLIYQGSAEAVLITDEENNIVDVNPAFTHLTGYTREEVLGRNPRLLQSGRHDKAFYEEMWRAILEKDRWQGELRGLSKDGSVHIMLTNISVIRHADGSIYRHVAQYFDITDRKQNEELIWKQANYDTLTGLPNRRLFLDRLEQETRKSKRSGLPLALLFIDLDRFKEINDTLGHAKGDMLLVEAAGRIRGCVRETDVVSRLGGDEFTIILAEYGEHLHIERIAQDIIHALSRRFELEGDSAYVSASIGITLYPDDAGNLEELIKHADQAMYSAKAQGRNRFSYFTPSLQIEAQEKLMLTNELRQALSRKELEVYYQAIVEMTDERVVKAEALLRWKHPKLGMVSPAAFIPLAEESGLILEIGEWVFDEVISSILNWQARFGRIIQVSVNNSPIQFEKAARHSWMERLEKSGLPAKSINVEITEGLLIKDSASVKLQLVELRNRGIEVSIDDFGTGFSALSYLKEFDIDYLKIDKSFVSNLTEDRNDRALTEAIIQMAHQLGIKTIAEGVETEAQRDLLISAGCDLAQGFFYSLPVPAIEFEKLLGAGESSTRPTSS